MTNKIKDPFGFNKAIKKTNQNNIDNKLKITKQTFLTPPVLVKTKEWQHPQVVEQNKIMDWQTDKLETNDGLILNDHSSAEHE